MSGRMRFAIVGCGAIAESHAKAILRSEEAELVAAIDTDRAAAEGAGKRWDCPAFLTLDEAVAAVEFEAACVCTPPALHVDSTVRLLEHGAHVLCEKPLAATMDQADRILSAAYRADRLLMVSSKFRFVDDLVSGGRYLGEGRIGKPLLYQVAFCSPVDVGNSWMIEPRLSGGGVTADNLCHALDVMSHFLAGEDEELVVGTSAPVLAESVEDTAVVLARAADGALVQVTLSWACSSKDLDYLAVFGTEGTIRVGWTGGQLRHSGGDGWEEFGSGYSKEAAFAGQLDCFLERAVAGSEPLFAGSSLRTLAVLDELRAAVPGSFVRLQGRRSEAVV